MLKILDVATFVEEKFGKRGLVAVSLVGISLLLGGCTTPTIRSEVTTFHEWQTAPQEKSYVFDRTKDQDNNLEYRSYEDLVRAELTRLGFAEVQDPRAAKLKTSMSYGMQVRDVRVVQPVVVDSYPYPYFYGSAYRGYAPYGPYYRPYYYSPFYDPFWYGPPTVSQRESNYQLFTRRLRVTLARAADGKKLYDTTVVSEGTNGSLATIMPYMIRSAFMDFPGESGAPRQVELKMNNK